MPQSGDLAAMIDRLAAMSAADRDYVLGQLGSADKRRLLPRLEQIGRAEVSSSLNSLIACVKRGDLPEGMPPRAAEALLRAASHGQPVESVIDEARSSSQARPLIARLMQRLGLES